jgi:hypothetical protein
VPAGTLAVAWYLIVALSPRSERPVLALPILMPTSFGTMILTENDQRGWQSL